MDKTVLLAAAYVKKNALPPNSPEDACAEALKMAAATQLFTTTSKPGSSLLIGLQVAGVFCGYDSMWQPGIESLLDHSHTRVNILDGSSAQAEQNFRNFCGSIGFEEKKPIETVVGFIRATEFDSLRQDDPATPLIHSLQDARLLTPIILQRPPELVEMISSRRGVDTQTASEMMENFLTTIVPKTSDGEFFFEAWKRDCYPI